MGIGNSTGNAYSSLSTWHTKPPVPEPPLKDSLLANEIITLMVTGSHTGYQSTLPMSYISNPAVIFTIMCLYEDVSVLWCVYRGQKITFRSYLLSLFNTGIKFRLSGLGSAFIHLSHFTSPQLSLSRKNTIKFQILSE